MKVLLVAGFFPPHAPSAATRANKLAGYLLRRGHDVRVLTAGGLPFPPVLTPEIPAERITYTDIFDINALPDRVIDTLLMRRGAAPRQDAAPATRSGDTAPPATPAASASLAARAKCGLRVMRRIYQNATNLPDAHIGWLPHAVRAGRRLIDDWRPDVIYSSAPPQTTSIVAHALGRRTGVPWIGEFRDLWVDHPYYDEPAWRRWIETRWERRVLGTARALVTVTEPWSVILREKYGKPTALVMNGFDPADFPDQPLAPTSGRDRVTIVYTGTLYRDVRDPGPLFEAVAALGPTAAPVRIRFYGSDLGYARELTAKYDIAANVEINAPIPYGEAVMAQRGADVLLLLRWNNPGEKTVVAGKLFEYFGARRPILSVGCEDGVAADLIRSRGAGLVSNDPRTIADQLQKWIALKRDAGAIRANPSSVRDGFSREDQFAILERFLEDQIALPAR